MNAPLWSLPVPTRGGVYLAHYSATGLAELDFPSAGRARARTGAVPAGNGARRSPPGKVQRWHRATTTALERVLAGRAAKRLPPLDWAGKTDFQQAVWRAMLELGPGQTKSYGEIARAIGRPKAVRAVGGACGANPIPVLVPCHRVLAANRKIGGFSSGLERKRELLRAEGVAL